MGHPLQPKTSPSFVTAICCYLQRQPELRLSLGQLLLQLIPGSLSLLQLLLVLVCSSLPGSLLPPEVPFIPL